MPSLIPLTQDALECLQRYLGKATADMYARSFSGKDQDEVLHLLMEGLQEVVGKTRAEDEVKLILKKHHLVRV